MSNSPATNDWEFALDHPSGWPPDTSSGRASVHRLGELGDEYHQHRSADTRARIIEEVRRLGPTHAADFLAEIAGVTEETIIGWLR